METLRGLAKKLDSLRKARRDRFVATGVPGEARWFAMLDRSSPCPLLERTTPLSVFFNRHKCASRYVTRVLTEYCEPQGIELKPRITWGYDILETDWALRHLSPGTRLITAGPGSNQVRDLLIQSEANFNGFHVFRDPRDMIVSGYFSHLNSHPVRWIHQKHHFQRIQGLSIEEGLRLEIDYLGWLELDALRTWDLSDQRIHNVKFEDLTAKPGEHFESIFSFLGLPVERTLLRTILEAVNFEKLSSGRSVGQEDRTSHYRSGRPGDWKNYLTGELYQYFLDRYGDVTEKLGYPTGTAGHTRSPVEGASRGAAFSISPSWSPSPSGPSQKKSRSPGSTSPDFFAKKPLPGFARNFLRRNSSKFIKVLSESMASAPTTASIWPTKNQSIEKDDDATAE